MNRSLGFRATTNRSHPNSDGRPQSNGEPEKNMWSSMLDSVASGKKLPEKNLIVLGGSPTTQKEFIETLDSENTPRKPQDRYRKRPPTANAFALGYTYLDVLDADHEDLLARLSIYFLSEPSSEFALLLKPLFSARSIPESIVVILLDWSEPWHWVRQLRNWIRFLKGVTSDLHYEAQEAMTTIMQEWQKRQRGVTSSDASSTNTGAKDQVNIPLSQGEWDEALGIPLCVVCEGVDRVDVLEKDRGWREEDFDFVLQYLRTILMKHGSSLIYTSISMPNSLPTLVHSSLGIHSLLKKSNLKHNVTDRDKILIPPNWDSWGKIRVLREGFDVEGVSTGWSFDIQLPSPSTTTENLEPQNGIVNGETHREDSEPNSPTIEGSVLPQYEETIKDPQKDRLPQSISSAKDGLEVECESQQSFLASQLARIEHLKKEEDAAAATEKDKSTWRPATTGDIYTTANESTMSRFSSDESRINEHIGPVQFNVGGIQVDADDVLQRMKSRERGSTRTDRGTPKESQTPTTSTPSKQDPKAQNEALANFFAGLMKKDRTGSPRGERTA